MIIPIAIATPAVTVFIPPAVSLAPAPLACFVQFMAPMLGLAAIPAVAFRGFVQFVVGLDDSPLAVVIIGFGAGRAGECE